MNDDMKWAAGPRKRSPRRCRAFAIAIASIVLGAALAGCGEKPRPRSDELGAPAPAGTARLALPVAEAAARAWMRDARLIYIENDSELGMSGDSPRWGFLFRSDLADSWRAISVAGGEIVSTAPLAYPFAAPDLPADWIDSSDAVRLAELAGGGEFRVARSAELAHVVLGRGIFTSWDGPPTWTVVYRAADRSKLAIVVSGTDGSIVSRFEG